MSRSRTRYAPAATLIALAALAIPAAAAAGCCGDSARAWRACEVVGSTADMLIVRWASDAAIDSIAIPTPTLLDAVRGLRRPAHALVACGEAGGGTALVALGVRVERWRRGAALIGVAAMFLIATALLTRGRPGRLALGQDGRYSKSTCQMLLWFAVLTVSYAATVALRWWAGGARFAGGVGVPDGLLVLSGMSALSFVGARAITQWKEDRAERLQRGQRAAASAVPRKTPASRPGFPDDLVNDDRGRADFGDFQMVVVTSLAAIVYAVAVFTCLGQVELACRTRLPDVDTTLLGAFGIAQGAYLAKKAASRPGEG